MGREIGDEEIVLTPRELAIAAKAAEIAIDKVYTEIGRSMVKRLMWAIGAIGLWVFMTLRAKGLI